MGITHAIQAQEKPFSFVENGIIVVLQANTHELYAAIRPQPAPLQIRLASEDTIRLQNLAIATGKTRGALAREALLNFLDEQEHRLTEKRETELEKRLRKMEDRLAGLWVRNSIDVGMIFLLMYRHMDKEERDKASKWAYAGAVKRLKEKLKDSEVSIRQQATAKEGDDKPSAKKDS